MPSSSLETFFEVVIIRETLREATRTADALEIIMAEETEVREVAK